MAQVQIGVGVVLAALSALGFLTWSVAGWVLLILGVAILLFGLFTLGLRLRFPIYKSETKSDSPVDDVEGDADGINADQVSDSNTSSPPGEPFNGVLTTMLNNDIERFQQCYQIQKKYIDWSGTKRKIGSRFIEFKFVITSSTVWISSLTDVLQGKLRYRLPRADEPGEIRQNPEAILSDKVKHLARTYDGTFTIRQYLPTEVHSDLRAASGEQITFLFDEISIDIGLSNPIGGPIVERKALQLHSNWVAEIPAIEP